jgi:hypothetical protein
MNDRLRVAVNARGGLSRRDQLKDGEGKALDHGRNLAGEGQARRAQRRQNRAELHKERLTTHFNGQGIRTVFGPNRITVETEGGRLVDSRDDPRSARGHTRQTPWDDLHGLR